MVRAIIRAVAAAALAAFIGVPSAPAQVARAYTPTTAAPWHAVEHYYLELVNCTRTGGWVQTDGTCSGFGSGQYSNYVAPLRASIGISDRVARPYARFLARRNLCGHYDDGDPGLRFRRAGYRNWAWGENVGCGLGYASAQQAVLASHLSMQAEQPTNGGHWQNIKNPRFTHAGVGIWVYAGRARVVTDLYRP